jgi:hypothetical protein
VRLSILVVLAVAGCKREPEHGAAADSIPLVSAPIAIDGELNEPAWNARALRGVLVGDDGAQARPYSEVRLLHDATSLYLGLYAADEDIRSRDHWQLQLGTLPLEIDATGHPSLPDAQVGVDRDGTLDHPDDYDEEWVLEVQLPLADIGAPPYAIDARRCDTPKDGHERCGRWQARLGLE